MNLTSVLYYRYLARQALLMFGVACVLITIINLAVFGSQNFDLHNRWLVITGFSAWIFPGLFLVATLVYWLRFCRLKTTLVDHRIHQLYRHLRNRTVRTAVVQAQIRIRLVGPQTNQMQQFAQAIQPLITKYKTLIALQAPGNLS